MFRTRPVSSPFWASHQPLLALAVTTIRVPLLSTSSGTRGCGPGCCPPAAISALPSAFLGRGYVVVTTYSGAFFTRSARCFGVAVALSMETGDTLWRTTLSGEALAIPASDGNVAVFQTQDGHVTALDVESGEQLWDYETPVPTLTLRGLAQPTLDNGKAYAGFANAKLAALDLENGIPLWEQRIAEPTGRSELDCLGPHIADVPAARAVLWVHRLRAAWAVPAATR